MFRAGRWLQCPTFRWGVAAIVTLFAGGVAAHATITVDTSTAVTETTGTTSFMFPYTLGVGTNRLVVCGVQIANPTSAVSNVTPTVMFGTVTMTAIATSQAPGSGQNTSKIESEMFYTNDTALGTASGSITVTVTLPSAPTGGVAAGCTSFFGAAQDGGECVQRQRHRANHLVDDVDGRRRGGRLVRGRLHGEWIG